MSNELSPEIIAGAPEGATHVNESFTLYYKLADDGRTVLGRYPKADCPNDVWSVMKNRTEGTGLSGLLPLPTPAADTKTADPDGAMLDRDRAGIAASEAAQAARTEQAAHAFFNQTTKHPAAALLVVAPIWSSR